jgi:hypothetical protein
MGSHERNVAQPRATDVFFAPKRVKGPSLYLVESHVVSRIVSCFSHTSIQHLDTRRSYGLEDINLFAILGAIGGSNLTPAGNATNLQG